MLRMGGVMPKQAASKNLVPLRPRTAKEVIASLEEKGFPREQLHTIFPDNYPPGIQAALRKLETQKRKHREAAMGLPENRARVAASRQAIAEFAAFLDRERYRALLHWVHQRDTRL